jgi:predicted GIY-YIG superfamily endonuclease
MPKQFYVYIMTNLPRRVHEHKNKLVSGFTSRFNLTG